MKIKNVYLALFALLALFMSSCTDDLKYAKMIPDDAYFVMRLDVKQTVEKCGLQENSKVKKSLTDALKESDLSRDLRDRIEQIFDKPATSGLDLRKPVFLYASKDGSYEETAVVGALHSESDFADLINAFAKEVDSKKVKETSDGVSYVEAGGSYVVFDDDWFYCGDINENKDSEAFVADIAKKIDKNDAPSFADSEEFKKMGNSGGVMQILFNGKGLDKIVKEERIKQVDELLPKDVKLKDATYMFDLTLDNGEMAVTGEFLTTSSQWTEYLKKNDEKLGDVKGDLLKYISKDGLSVIANINGQHILDALKDAGLLEESGDNNEIYKLLPSVNGDLAINITDVKMQEQLPVMSAYVQTKDDAIVNLLAQMTEGQAQKVGEQEYLIKQPGNGAAGAGAFNASFGYKNNISYIAMGESPTIFTQPANAYSMNDIKGKKLYVRLGFAALEKMANSDNSEDAEIVKKLAKICDYAELFYEGQGKYVLRLVTKDKAKTPAASLIDLAYDLYDAFNNRVRMYEPDYSSADTSNKEMDLN